MGGRSGQTDRIGKQAGARADVRDDTRYVLRPSPLLEDNHASFTFAVHAWLDDWRASMPSRVASARARLLPRCALSNLPDAGCAMQGVLR